MEQISDVSRMHIYRKYTAEYGIDGKHPSDLSKGTARTWTAYRQCAEDWLLSVQVVRATRERYEVGLFLAEDHVLFKKDTSIRVGLIATLSDAYKKTGKMALKFCGPREGQKPTLQSGYEPDIPPNIIRFASKLSVKFKKRGLISDEEGRALYFALSNFSPELIKLLEDARIDPVHTAFLSARGVWKASSIEHLLKHAFQPERLFEGIFEPDLWLTAKQNLIAMRMALMSERVHTFCEIHSGEGRGILESRWCGTSYMEFRVPRVMKLPNPYTKSAFVVPADRPLLVRLVPRNHDEYNISAKNDLSRSPEKGLYAVAVTKDFDWTSDSVRELAKAVAQKKVNVIRLVDTVDELDAEGLTRLARAATTKASVAEQRDD